MTFYINLVQRVLAQNDPEKEGIDRYFLFDYMGASEFEFGILGKSLRKMRETATGYNPHGYGVEKLKLTVEEKDYALFYVGVKDPELLAETSRFFASQIARKQDYRPLERTGIADTLAPTAATLPERRLIGWWIIGNEDPVIVFTKRSDAERWFNFLRVKKAS